MEKLSIRKEEYYLLKALTLSNCDVQLDNHNVLREFRESILAALNDCVFLLRSVFKTTNHTLFLGITAK